MNENPTGNTNEGRAFLSGLGRMGRRHLVGLLRAGYPVVGWDPDPSSVEAAHRIVRDTGFPSHRLEILAEPPMERFAIAVFAETAPHRLENLRRFLHTSRADRILLEKPLTSDPEKLESYTTLLAEHRISADQVFVNLTLRTLPLFLELRELSLPSREIVFTLNGGAKGIGCNALHYLDLFLALTSEEPTGVQWSHLSQDPLPSARGVDFVDFGGEFLVRNRRGIFFGSLSAYSSASPVLTIRGDHFISWVDEGAQTFLLRSRDPGSTKPTTLYGQDYTYLVEGPLDGADHAILTEKWARGKIELPSLPSAKSVHALLFALLASGGAPPPYRFT